MLDDNCHRINTTIDFYSSWKFNVNKFIFISFVIVNLNGKIEKKQILHSMFMFIWENRNNHLFHIHKNIHTYNKLFNIYVFLLMEKNKRKNEVFCSSEFIRRYRAMTMEKLVYRSKVEKKNVIPITYSFVILFFYYYFYHWLIRLYSHLIRWERMSKIKRKIYTV